MPKNVMYVGCYTNDSDKGIRIYDVNDKNGALTEKGSVAVSNSSFIAKANTKPVLYSITDEGVEAFKIEKDGMLSSMGELSTQTMRGCYLSTDSKDKLLFTGGFHDGKITMISLNEDGSLGSVLDSKHHKNTGSGMDRMSMGHVCCVCVTPDDNYLCAADSGLDQVKIYKIDRDLNQMVLIDMLRCELDSDPVKMIFSPDGEYAYLLYESKRQITVYKYNSKNGYPTFTLVQKISTVGKYHMSAAVACSLRIDSKGKYAMASNDGDNTVAFYRREFDGSLSPLFVLPISGRFPKDVILSDDQKHIYSLNHDESMITVFSMNYKDKLIAMSAKPVKIESPNSAVFVNLNKINE